MKPSRRNLSLSDDVAGQYAVDDPAEPMPYDWLEAGGFAF